MLNCGDINTAGKIGIWGQNGNTGFRLVNYSNSNNYVDIETDSNNDFLVGGCNLYHYYQQETRIGTWINGKPLYRKVKHMTSGWSIGGEVWVGHDISNVEDIWLENAFIKRGDGMFEPIPCTHSYMSDWGAGIFDINDVKFTLWLGTMSGATISSIDVILNYTKTTD